MTDEPVLLPPKNFTDQQWQEKVQRAIEARAAAQERRKGKAPAFPTHRLG
jgi:hypothetical protein